MVPAAPPSALFHRQGNTYHGEDMIAAAAAATAAFSAASTADAGDDSNVYLSASTQKTQRYNITSVLIFQLILSLV